MSSDPRSAAVVAALRAHGLLDPADVVDVRLFSQRSVCVLVALGDGRALFAKQAQRTATGTWTADVVGEGRRMAQLRAVPVVRSLVPEVLLVDEDLRLVVVEGLMDAVALDEARSARGGSDPDRAAALGTALAALHEAGPPAGLPVVDHVGPSVRSWGRLTPRSVTLFPQGYREIAVRIQGGDLLDQLGDLAASWRSDSVIHGDVKSDNVLCDASAPVRLVDWECAGRGDARWDVGSAVGDYLFTWLRTMRVSRDGGLAAWIQTARPALSDLRAELTALLETYRAGRAVRPGEEDLAVWMRYAGVFLLHRLTMTAMQSLEVSSSSLATLQLSRQLVRAPHTALEVLLP